MTEQIHKLLEEETPEKFVRRWMKYINLDKELKVKLWELNKVGINTDNSDDVLDAIEDYVKVTSKSNFNNTRIYRSKSLDVALAFVEEILEDFDNPDDVVSEKEIREGLGKEDLEQQAPRPTIKFTKRDGTIGYKYKTIRFNEPEIDLLSMAINRGLKGNKVFNAYMARFKFYQKQEDLKGHKEGAIRWRSKNSIMRKFYLLRKKLK